MKVYIVEVLNQIDETYSDVIGVYTSEETAKLILKEEFNKACNDIKKDHDVCLNERSFEVYNDEYKIEGYILEDEVKIDSQTLTDIAANIMESFDLLLEQHNIKIPDSEREGSEDEAAIYGKTYFDLEEQIKDHILS